MTLSGIESSRKQEVLDSVNVKILDVGEVDAKEIVRVLGGVEEGALKAERELVNVPETKPKEKESYDELDRRVEERLKKIREAKNE